MNNFKVSTRLIAGFGILIALLLVISVLSLMRLSGLNEGMGRVVNDRVPKVIALEDIAYRAMDNARIVRNIILVTDEKSIASNKQAYDKNVAAISEQIAELDKTVIRPEAKEALAAMKAAREAYVSYTGEVIALGMANKNDEATRVLYGEKYKTQAAYLASIRAMIDQQKKLMTEAATAAQDSYASARAIVLVLSVVACVLGAVLALVITRGLLRQLGGEPQDAANVARRIADGDLSVSVAINSGDTTSLMAAMALMKDNLARVVGQVRTGVDGVATASSQIAQGNQDLSARTEQQASNLQQTAASMEQMTGAVKSNADNARAANQLAASASDVAAKGGSVVSQVVSTMGEIQTASKKIADIIGTIDGIAFQTNILALNAAVEAARAGEQVRGFAVVAGEVRSLAQRSAEAAKEIKSLIGASVERVDAGSTLVDEAGQTMSEIVAQVRKVTDLIGEITASSSEQTEGIGQVNTAVTQLDQMTQQNAALVEESAAAAESLKQQAARLAEAVSVFKLGHEQAAHVIAHAQTSARHADAHAPVKTAVKAAPRSEPKAARAHKAPAVSKPVAPAPAPRTEIKATARSDDGDWETF